MTMLIATLVLMYAAIKFEHLITRHNPNINDYYIDTAIDETVNLNDHNFRIAFTVEDYNAPYGLKDSEEYVKWIFREFGIKDGVSYERIVPHHKCTEEDYAEFYQIEKNQAKELDEIKRDPKRDFYCLDWEDENPFEIYGT